MLDPHLLFLAPIVFVAGFIDSIAGGGGLLTVPAYLIVGIPPTLTLGTNKFVSTMGTIVSTTKYILGKRILWPVAIVGVLFAFIGSAIGAHWISLCDQTLVRKIILIALPIGAGLTLIPKPRDHHETRIEWTSWRLWILIPIISATLGWYDGVFGPGTGSLLLLALYGIAQLSFLHAAATARWFNLISNLGSLVAFLVHGQVIFSLALPLSVFGIAGHWCGSHMALKRGDRIVRAMLIVSCALLFGYLLWSWR